MAKKMTLRRGARHVGRLRWLTKRRILRRYDVRLRQRPGDYLRYLLVDAEVESYSFELANAEEVGALAAEAFAIAPEQAAVYASEIERDPELDERLRERIRWRFNTKRSLPLGNRLLWWLVLRITKPRLVVETGIYDGLWSLVPLRALEYNAREGHDGQLLSVDTDPHAGRLVPARLRGRWTIATGMSHAVLEPELGSRPIDVLVHDTPHTAEIQRHEFGVALRHPGDPLVIVEASGYSSVLPELAARLEVPHRYIPQRSRRHIYPGGGQGVLVVPRTAAESWDGAWS